MDKYYYLSDRIIGVYFHNRKSLEDYYKRATKLEDANCGNITQFETSGGLEEYIKRNNTHSNNMWKLG